MARLDEICTLNMGQSPDSSSYNEIGDGMPFFQGNADFGSLHPTVRVWCNSPTKTASPGDILISVRAPIGALNIADMDCCIGRGLAALTVNEKLCLKEYLWYAIASKVEELNEKGTGSTFKAIGKSVLAETEIPLPLIDRQRDIASILDRLSNLISLRKQQLAKLDELVKARFVEMFGTYSRNTIKADAFMSEMRNGLSPSSSGGHHAKVLTLSAVTQGMFDANAWKDGCFVDPPPDDKRICATDFYICRGNGNKALVGTGVYSTDDHFDLIFPDTVIAAQINEDIVRLPYLYMAWKTPDVRRQIEENVRTTNGTYKINQKVIANIELSVPPLFAQDDFTEFIQQSNTYKLTIQQSFDKLEMLKKALMQEYFG